MPQSSVRAGGILLGLLLGAAASGAAAGAAPSCGQPFSLSTRGRYLVDGCGERFKLRAVNWFGASDTREVVGGLDKQPLAHLVGLIRKMGFNSVRLPFSNQMLHRTGPVNPRHLAANPALVGKTPLEVYDAVVKGLTEAGLVVILNNHTTVSEWCCGYDHNGLWYTHHGAHRQTTEQWLQDWTALVRRYRGNRLVAGADLRNEVRTMRSGLWPAVPNWGAGDENDWRRAARAGADRVLAVNPELLVIVEGIDWWGLLPILGGERPHLKPIRHDPLGLPRPRQLMYAVHHYAFVGPRHAGDARSSGGRARYGEMDRHTLFETLDQEAGYVAQEGYPYSTPVWVSEFGVSHDPSDPKARAWFSALVDYLIDRDLDFAYWPLNPEKNDGPDHFGLLTGEWAAVRDDWRTPHLRRLLAAGGRTGAVSADTFRTSDPGQGDDNQSATLGDWDPSSVKATCPDGFHATGLSRAHRVLCTDQHHGALWSAGRETVAQTVGESPRPCPTGHYVAGISRRPGGASGLLCAKANRPLGTTCQTVRFEAGDQRLSMRGGDWAPGAPKGQCGDDQHVAGVAQRNGGVSALLCCR